MARARSADPSSMNVDDLKKDLHGLRQDLSELTKQVEGLASDAGAEMVEELKARLATFGSSVDDLVSSAGARGRDAVDMVSGLGGNVVENVEDVVRERPFTALAIAVGLGFVLSSTMRR